MYYHCGAAVDNGAVSTPGAGMQVGRDPPQAVPPYIGGERPISNC